MGKRFYVVLTVVILLISSCAQVGTISGGKKDAKPPSVVENGMNPPNGSLNFNQNIIQIKFDEYIKLNNPIETISLVPGDAKVSATLNKKTVVLKISGELKPETTYAIYLNGTVQDITENNDSLLQYVFSTGNYIDTLTYSGFVSDAYTYKSAGDVLVGLYPDTDSSLYKKPSYFGKTNASGQFNLSYIKPGKYKILAFEDKNRDMIWQKTERVGFSNELLQIDSSMIDSIPLRIFSPLPKRKITANYVPPSLLTIASNRELSVSEVRIDTNQVAVLNQRYNNDSISFLIRPPVKNQMQVIIRQTNLTDTITVRISEKEKIRKPVFETNLEDGYLPADLTMNIRFSDIIERLNDSLVELIYSDSLKFDFEIKKIAENELQLKIDSSLIKSFNLRFLENSIVFKNYKSKFSSTIILNNRFDENFGALSVFADSLPDYALIEVMRGEKAVRSFVRPPLGKGKLLEWLAPDTYTFRIIMDENKNGKWDSGDLERQIQPEKIMFFTKGVKVRANWEMELTLVPENK